jgi:hypothetical protein
VNRRRALGGRPPRRTLSLGALLLVGAIALAVALLSGGGAQIDQAAGRLAAGEPTPQTDSSVPARGVMMIGSSPLEAPAETWGIGESESAGRRGWTIVRYAAGEGWSPAPGPLDAAGAPLSGFKPDASVIAGQVTPAGSAALLGVVEATHGEESATPRRVLLVRDHGGAFKETSIDPSTALEPGESLYSQNRSPLLAALDEGGSRAGALVVPVLSGPSGLERAVLHWDGEKWTREPIEKIPLGSEGFRVLAIGASSPSNAWLLAQLSASSGSVALFSRHGEGKSASWLPVALTPGKTASEPEPLKVPVYEGGSRTEVAVTVPGTGTPPSTQAQILTVSDEGVWIDGQRRDTPTPLTMFFKPSAGGESGEALAGWCNAPGGFPSCAHALPDLLPTGPSRSFAWADPSNPEHFGQRVITGLSEGVSLRLDGASFTRVLALGEVEPDAGGSLGAAFSGPREGWLGNALLPVHLTTSPVATQLTPYPVSFHRALVAIAPQPGAPIGALSSEALAVGDQGEVARFIPGEGWMPESLLGAGGRRSTPRLRAVAWPTPNRAYAVGELGEMWLWRGETGLWEPDPATPLNFRGDLLGIAFDPNNPSRGYAVGQAGALLGFGKSWSQQPLPPEAAGASFTSIAFAGSEAIAAYRVPHPQGTGEGAHYTSGLLVNDGSGWHTDSSAAAALGDHVPWAVAGLPDGGAAVSAGAPGEAPLILERSGPGAPWLAAPVPYSGFETPSSLALFREAGALRVIGSGSVPSTLQLDTSEKPPPVGFPPNLTQPYPLTAGYVMRQTAVGWRDEQPERNNALDPPGEYKVYDAVYQPDPISAVLVDPSGALGWAVGGIVDTANNGALDTADVARYPADGVPPPGFAAAPVQGSPALATFAIAGNANCLAPCADRAAAGIGPDVWLSSALERASQISGVRAFLYTGQRVTSGAGRGAFPVPYEREFARYAALLGSSAVPAYAVAAPTDRGPGSECPFEQAFSGFPAPFGGAPTAPGLASGGRSSEACSAEASRYYALRSSGPAGSVRLIMLDESSEVAPTQLAWLEEQLRAAKGLAEPAIAIGSADLNAQIAAGSASAAKVAQVLLGGGASAYFYDAPEQNVQLPLRVGSSSIPTFGSGTLGYVGFTSAAKQDFTGHSGFLLGQVNVAARDPSTNRAPVTTRLIPDIGQLALEAKDGILLRRSQPALFAALARRPLAGGRSPRGATLNESATYIPIPANCIGPACATGIFPEYSFSSSRPDIGDFVQPNLASSDPHAVLLGSGETPIADAASGLFCAYNAGTTVVTISAGGLLASLTVTVQAGSVRRPCGTQPLKEVASEQQVTAPPPPPPAAPAQAGPASSLPLVPLPPVPAVIPPAIVHAPPASAPAPFIFPAAPTVALLPFVPLPPPSPARPTPPSGTSAVTSPIQAPEREEEEEGATESVSNQAVAYSAGEHEPSPAYILGIVLLAAFAGASVRRRTRRGRRDLHVAPATVSAYRSQRRMEPERRPARWGR